MTNQQRVKLPPNYKLPNAFKCLWFMKLPKADQRVFMLAHQLSVERIRNSSKRDAETYAESAQNRNTGRNANTAN